MKVSVPRWNSPGPHLKPPSAHIRRRSVHGRVQPGRHPPISRAKHGGARSGRCFSSTARKDSPEKTNPDQIDAMGEIPRAVMDELARLGASGIKVSPENISFDVVSAGAVVRAFTDSSLSVVKRFSAGRHLRKQCARYKMFCTRIREPFHGTDEFSDAG